MVLNCLMLTKDVGLQEVIRTRLRATSVALEIYADATNTLELSGRRHFDGFVIDCDVVLQAADLLAQIRKTRSNKMSVIVAIVNGRTAVSMAIDAGANFVLGKPVQDRQLQSILAIALPRMEREHRRYGRHKVDLPVEFLSQSGEAFAGKIMNVSECGVALIRFDSSPITGMVAVRFGLSSADRKIFQAKADVVWNDTFAMGLRFLRIEPECRSSFAAWLDSLERGRQPREVNPVKQEIVKLG